MNKREREEVLRWITEMQEFALFGKQGPNLDMLCKILRVIVRALPKDKDKDKDRV